MNIVEISDKFPDELAVIKYAIKIRWGKKIKCVYCGSTNIGTQNKDFRWHCKNCKKSFSVTTNTNLHNTRLPLKTWFYAIAVITDAKKGISSLQLHRNIGVHYETAFNMAHKLRSLMKEENKTIELSEVVEMDETIIVGKPRKYQYENKATPKVIPELDKKIKELKSEGYEIKEGEYKKPAVIGKQKRGRGAISRGAVVGGIVERGGDVIAEVMNNTTYAELKKLVEKYVDTENSVLISDEFKGYNRFNKIIEHVKIDHSKMYSYKGLNTNSIESFWAIIKRGIIGQYHKVSPKYLPNYIAEFVYKYNNRDDNEYMFDELLIKCLQVKN